MTDGDLLGMESDLRDNLLTKKAAGRPRVSPETMNAIESLMPDQRGDVSPHPSRDRIARSDGRQNDQHGPRVPCPQPREAARAETAEQRRYGPTP